MKKRLKSLAKYSILLCLTVMFVLFISACDSLRYGGGNLETGNVNYCLTRIEKVPDGWTETGYQFYYYHIDTKVVYFGQQSLSRGDAIVVKLESEEFDKYIYDEENNKFIGVE